MDIQEHSLQQRAIDLAEHILRCSDLMSSSHIEGYHSFGGDELVIHLHLHLPVFAKMLVVSIVSGLLIQDILSEHL